MNSPASTSASGPVNGSVNKVEKILLLIGEDAAAAAALLSGGAIAGDLKIASLIATIVAHGIEAYQAHTGEAIDPALLHTIEPV